MLHGVLLLIGGEISLRRVPVGLRYLIAGFAMGVSSIGVLYVPVVVEQLPEKSPARSTMAVLWLLLASVRIPIYLWRGVLTGALLQTAALSVPFVIVGIVVGYLVHRRLRHNSFQRFVGVTLAIVGILVVLPALF